MLSGFLVLSYLLGELGKRSTFTPWGITRRSSAGYHILQNRTILCEAKRFGRISRDNPYVVNYSIQVVENFLKWLNIEKPSRQEVFR